MTQCSICLNEVRETRHSKAIRCGHIFHSHCLENWKKRGKVTCPVCRKVFDGSKFRVQISIFNDYELTSNTITLENELVFDALDVFFAVENENDLTSILSDFGVGVSVNELRVGTPVSQIKGDIITSIPPEGTTIGQPSRCMAAP